MSDDVTALEDEIESYGDGTVARVRVLSVTTARPKPTPLDHHDPNAPRYNRAHGS